MLHDIYWYDNKHSLLYDNNRFTCECNFTDSRPMNERLIKLHKGVDNYHKFRVFDSDRKKASIEHLRIYATLVNKETREQALVVEGKLEAKGLVSFLFLERELVGLPTGYYRVVITGAEFVAGQNGNSTNVPFYVDMVSNIDMEALVTDTAEMVPSPTVQIADWSQTTETVNLVSTLLYCSQAVPVNNAADLHTLALKASNFRGLFQVRGSLEHIAPPVTDVNKYFLIDIGYDNGDYKEYGVRDINDVLQPFSGIEYLNVEQNAIWIVCYWLRTDSTGTPILSTEPPDSGNVLDLVQIR